MDQLPQILRLLLENLRDLAPLVLVVAFFHALVLQEAPPDLATKIVGAVLVLLGLTFFVRGLSMSLFPLGEGLADTFARRGNLTLLLAFAFAIGFGSTVAEPALYAVTMQAAKAAAAAGPVARGEAQVEGYALVLRYAAAAAVGVAVALSCLRIVLGWPAVWFLLGGYGLVTAVALVWDAPMLGIAADAGAAATSAINIPLMAALGIGLASTIRGRRPLADGFGMVAFASLMAMLTVLIGSLAMG